MSEPGHGSLSKAHRGTLDAVFRHPIARNLEWDDVVSLFGEIGGVEQKAGNEVAFQAGGERQAMRKPHTKDLAASEVLELRRLLSRAGFGPNASQPVTGPEPEAPGLLVAMDHHGARVFRLDVSSPDPAAHTVAPYDPHGFLHHLAHKDQPREHGQRAAEDSGYYERIAQTVADGGHVVVVGHGKGHSNAAHHLMEYLRSHHRQAYGPTVTEITADLSSLTDPQLLAIGRDALRGPAG